MFCRSEDECVRRAVDDGVKRLQNAGNAAYFPWIAGNLTLFAIACQPSEARTSLIIPKLVYYQRSWQPRRGTL